MKSRLAGLLMVGSFTMSTAAASGSNSHKVLMRNVQSITVRKGRMTTHRRVPAVPQLKCASGSGCKHYQVEVMRCKNAGPDYSEDSIQWICQADIPEYFKLGSTDVKCEGYSNSEDAFILKGSCGVEYRLVLTDKGMERYGRGKSWFLDGHDDNSSTGSSKVFGFVFWLVFVGIILWMIRSFLRNRRETNGRQGRSNNARRPRRPFDPYDGGWRPDGGDDGGDDDPPPYSHVPYRKSASGQSQRSGQTQGWQPGFWTGLLGGGAAAYAAGRATGHLGRQSQQNSHVGGWSSPSSRDDRHDDSNGSGGPSSTTFYTSTGFGESSNR